METLIKKIRSTKLRILLTVLSGALVGPAVALAIVSLNGQADQDQSFANDANITVNSANNTHTIGWNGVLPVSRGGTGTGSFTAGSVLFSNGTIITEDNSNLFFNDTTNALTVGGNLSVGNNITAANLSGTNTGDQDLSGLVPYTGATADVNLGAHYLSTTGITTTDDSTINTLTIGLGGGSVSSNTAVGNGALSFADSTSGANTAVGEGALRSIGNGFANTAVGYNASTDSIGAVSNTAVGYYALRNNTTGSLNNAFGSTALNVNRTGSRNTAMGLAALQFNYDGNNNTAIGHAALNQNSGGSNNVALGVQAGRFQADGSTNLTTTENSVYLGGETKGYDNNDSNSIVIGYNATGAGANKAVIGNSSMTDVYFGSASGLANIHAANVSTVSSGTSAPTSIPSALGQIYIETSAAKVYISTGTSSHSDWKIMN